VTARLEVRDLNVSFRRGERVISAVRGVDLEAGAGRTLVLLGESGSGKSVTANAILRLYGRSARIDGSVRLDGEELLSLPEKRMRALRGRTVSMVPQDPSAALDPLRRVGDQIVEVLGLWGVARGNGAARRIAAGLLERVGIAEPERVLRSLPFELSGGMRQRIAIAIAVACEPRLLIADEPTTALDVTVQAKVLDLFAELQRANNMSMIVVTHDVGVARMIGHDIAVMYAGRIVESGPMEQVLSAPRHPYTAGLLEALPTPGIPRGELRAIPGRPPGPGEAIPDDACAFVTRCAFAVASCSAHRPRLEPVGAGQSAACDVIDAPIATAFSADTAVVA